MTKQSTYNLSGERAAIGGYLPQYDEFAIKVYDALLSGDLEEIRVADMEDTVGKLDDIVYVTNNDVFAYQVKWTNNVGLMYYLNFKALLPKIVDGWRKLCRLYPDKTVRPILLTNKQLASRDNSLVEIVGRKSGGFALYKQEVLDKLKNSLKVSEKWIGAIEELKSFSTLTVQEWEAFWQVFSFVPEYKQVLITITDAINDQRTRDIIDINRSIQEIVGRSNKLNPVTVRDLISMLGWNNRYKTTFEHNIIVPEESYIPNARGIQLLNDRLKAKTKGYIFLKGSPGSGKSTLLTQWLRNIENQSVRFYSFDFLNPSSQRNNESSRGESITFLHDIVLQIHEAGIESNKTLPLINDYVALKERLYEQMDAISEQYKNSHLPFIIVVDGLDHITREYKDCRSTLMNVLPSPSDIPEGVIFVLGSQHFDHLHLNPEIEKTSKIEDNFIEMPSFSQCELDSLCRKLLPVELISEEILGKCWVKAQGHPLFLRYILNQVVNNGPDVLDSVESSTEGVEDYYRRIVGNLLEDNPALNNILGLISRIYGPVKLDDIRAMCPDENSMGIIRQKMWHLFDYDRAGQEISFFHNSFRQFLLDVTAEDTLTKEYSKAKSIAFYKQLSEYFTNDWAYGYYLYKSEEYDKFLSELTAERLTEQIRDFRPIWSVQRDMERGVEIARSRRDPYLLVRYLLLDNQLNITENQDCSVLSIIEELISVGRTALAKSIIREGKILHCSQEYAMELALKFLEIGDRKEANLLFDLSYPTFIFNKIDSRKRHFQDYCEKKRFLDSWVRTAGYFIEWKIAENHIAKFCNYLELLNDDRNQKFDRNRVLQNFTSIFLSSLAERNKWQDFDEAVQSFITNGKISEVCAFRLYESAIALIADKDESKTFLHLFYERAKELQKGLPGSVGIYVRMAYLASIAEATVDEIKGYITGVNWEELGSFYQQEVSQHFNTLSRHIFYVKIRAMLGIEDKVTDLVPDDDSHPDNSVMVSYARRLFSLAQMIGKAKAGIYDSSYLSQVTLCIRAYDSYLNPVPHNRFSYTLSQHRGDFYEFAIESSINFGTDYLPKMARLFEAYFAEPSCRADADSKRKAIMAFSKIGYDKEWCENQLLKIEVSMMQCQDTDGRERECLCQGKAWSKIGRFERAESHFRRMICESFGVGYRKDYQPTLFAEWLGIAVKNDSQKAVDYIHWLTSRLGYIDNIAESRTCVRASEKLLDDSFAFNMATGLKLSKWMLDSEYNYFQSVSSSFISALLSKVVSEAEYNIVLNYFLSIHLYFDDNDPYDLNTHLLEQIVRTGERIMGKDTFTTLIPYLECKLKTECSESISDALSAHINDMFKEPSEKEANPDRMRNCDKLVAEAEKLLSVGRRNEAWEKGMDALNASSSSGWARYYDGGTRLNACAELQKIDVERGRDVTIDVFSKDVVSDYTYGTIHYIDEIVPLLCESVDQKRLFQEEFAYMNRILREDSVNENDKPEIAPEELAIPEIMRDWLLWLAAMPVICLSERSKEQLAHLYNSSNITLLDLPDGKKCSDRILLEVACYLEVLHSGRLSDFKEIALNAASSGNYQFRVYASKILKGIDEEIPSIPIKRLPAIYSFRFPEQVVPAYSWLPKKKHVEEINWRDAGSIMGVASHIGNYLSYCSGIDKRTLDYRAVELMREYGDTTEGNVAKDRRVGYHYDKIALRYPYRKAHVQAALDGMFSVASELLDGQVIRGRYNDSVMLSRDFNNILVNAQPKPDFIQRISDKGAWSEASGWLSEYGKSPRLGGGVPLYNDRYVIGEFTHIKMMTDNQPTEEFKSKLSFFYEKNETDEYNPFFGDSFFMCDTSEYRKNPIAEDSEVILIRSGYYTDFTNKSHWIAINPAIVSMLQLKPCEEGYFAWQDASGKKQVESVYWQCGNINGASRNNYEASEGWIVVAAPEFVKKLCEICPVYTHRELIRRTNENMLDDSHKIHYVDRLTI